MLRFTPLMVTVVLIVVPAASAQAPGPEAVIAVAPATVGLTPGNATTVAVTVTNDGAVDGNLDLSIEGAGSYWMVELGDVPASVAAGSAVEVPVTVSLAEGGGEADATSLTFVGTLTDASGAFTSSDEATLTANVDMPLVLQAAPPPPPVGLYVGGVVLALVALTGGVAAAMLVPRERALAVRATKTSGAQRPGKETYYRVEVENRWRSPAVVEVDVKEAPEGWKVGTDVSRVVVEPGETGVVCVAVHVPEEATPETTGVVTVVLHHALARFTRHTVALETMVEQPPRRTSPPLVKA